MKSASSRLPGLEALRALAILWVILFHAGTLGLGWVLGEVSRLGWMGVDLFFVLSGFLIGVQWFSALHEKTASFAGFFRRRAWRILPAYLAVVALYVLVPVTQERAQMMPLWQFLTFTENLFIDCATDKTFSHVWSLCVEEHFYVVFPLAALLLVRARAGWKTAVVVALTILFFGMGWRAWVWLSDVSVRPEAEQVRGFSERIYYPTWTRLDGLLAGVLLAATKVWQPRWWGWLQAHRLALGMLGGNLVLGAAVLFQETTMATVVFGYPLLSLGLGLLVAASAGPDTRSIPGASAIAALSYSLYLTHLQALHLAKGWFHVSSVADDAMGFALSVVSVFALGALVYACFERTGLRLRDRGRPTSARP